MLNYTNLEDIKELLEKILEQLEFMNLSPKQKQEEWDFIEGEQQKGLQEISEKYKVKTQEETPKPE